MIEPGDYVEADGHAWFVLSIDDKTATVISHHDRPAYEQAKGGMHADAMQRYVYPVAQVEQVGAPGCKPFPLNSSVPENAPKVT